MSPRTCLPYLAAALLQLGAASAQESLVAVDISALAPEIAATLDTELDEIPASLQLPASQAAEVCAASSASLGGACVAADLMFATRYTAYAIGDREPIYAEPDGDYGARATNAARQVEPWSHTITAQQ